MQIKIAVLLISLVGAVDWSFKNFGMNKPHHLFHLGQRKIISMNTGFSYWVEKASQSNNNEFQSGSNFSPLRVFYETQANGLYVNMKLHDGQSILHEEIQDSRYKVNTSIKYQLMNQHWQAQITMQKNTKDIVTWMQYFNIQNNDIDEVQNPSLIEYKKYTIEKRSNKQIIILSHMNSKIVEKTVIKCTLNIKMYGLILNISQSYDIRLYLNVFKDLIELKKYPKMERKNDSKIIEWQNEQLKIIKQSDWQKKYYNFIIIYGNINDVTKIIISNSSKIDIQWNTNNFQNKQQQIKNKHFPSQKYGNKSNILQHMIFNLYGGVCFYYGRLLTQNSLLYHQEDYSYSFTPSRLIFPRSFLWDDGFHLSITVQTNPILSMKILTGWFNKIDLFGWIGRQQIRGSQMTLLMPDIKFIYQDIFQLNPPTLLIPLLTLLEKSNQNILTNYQTNMFNELIQRDLWKLEKWFRYFEKTQSHYNLMYTEQINKTLKYRWRCKDDCQNNNFMGSGLDDYPRVQQKKQVSKQHIDLISWMYLFTDVLEQLHQYLNVTSKAQYYSIKKQKLQQKLFNQCLDQNDLLFKDMAVIDKQTYIDQFVHKIGYITLMPFATGMLRGESEEISAVLNKSIEIMNDQSLLLSQDGLRSLSLNDSDYGTEQNYWRGPVWMPINYMILRACKKYYWQIFGIPQLYDKIRNRLIHTVVSNQEETGYLYENYHNGKGHRGYPFYGWTTLLINIIIEKY